MSQPTATPTPRFARRAAGGIVSGVRALDRSPVVRLLKRLATALLARLRRLGARDFRLASGLVMLAYLATHLTNHAIGLISLDAAEAGLVMSAQFWSSWWGTRILYSSFAVHFFLAFLAIYERRTFRLPPLQLLRIALGLWLPVLLLGHFTATRLEFEVIGSDPTYGRIVAELWASDSELRQIGLLAPGWLHGCLGLYYALGHRALWRRLQFILFAIALLLPVLSALGFVTMARDLARNAVAEQRELATPLSPEARETRDRMKRWLDGLLWGYAGLVGLTFAARGVRIVVEHHRRGRVTITYPNRKVTVPRGWSVLDASRAFHIAHASSCGGRARCSTCRVRVNSGADSCPEPSAVESATLERIAAEKERSSCFIATLQTAARWHAITWRMTCCLPSSVMPKAPVAPSAAPAEQSAMSITTTFLLCSACPAASIAPVAPLWWQPPTSSGRFVRSTSGLARNGGAGRKSPSASTADGWL
jgi:ferredoxin